MDTFIRVLKENGFKVTAQRMEIIKIFIRRPGLFTPEDIFNTLKKTFPKVSYPSVYRNLEQMKTIGILTKLTKPDRRLYYALCRVSRGKHHHHIICTKCGRVGEIEECDILNRKEINGFKITGHYVQFEGICPKCRK